jgi:hypothetical protein
MSRVRRFRPTCRDSADSTDHFAVHPPFSTSTSLPLATTIALIPIIGHRRQRWQGIKAESYFLGSMSSPR